MFQTDIFKKELKRNTLIEKTKRKSALGRKGGPKAPLPLHMEGTSQTAITEPAHLEKGSAFHDQMANATLQATLCTPGRWPLVGNQDPGRKRCFGANRSLPFTNCAALLWNSLCHSALICKTRTIPTSQHFSEDKKKKGKKIGKVLCVSGRCLVYSVFFLKIR